MICILSYLLVNDFDSLRSSPDDVCTLGELSGTYHHLAFAVGICCRQLDSVEAEHLDLAAWLEVTKTDFAVAALHVSHFQRLDACRIVERASGYVTNGDFDSLCVRFDVKRVVGIRNDRVL